MKWLMKFAKVDNDMTDNNYDSTKDTLEHIQRVRDLLDLCVTNLQQRGAVHDSSKLKEPEKSAYDKITIRLKNLEYGSEEYRASLREMKPAIQHHYANNSHHPEYYSNGINGMSLFDLIEMLCDWKAASERHASGDIRKSLDINQDRFGMNPQLYSILSATLTEMGY